MCSILLTTCHIIVQHKDTHAYMVVFHVQSVSIPVCVMDEEVSAERTFTSDQIFRSQIDSDLDIRCWVMYTKVPVCACVHGMWLCACLSLCAPKIIHVCTNLPNGSKVLLLCRLCAQGHHVKHYLSLLHADYSAVSTHMLVQVQRSGSERDLSRPVRVQIWTWYKSYVQKERISDGLLTRVPLHVNRYKIRREME